jgi:FixJ family two-component response regulator
VQHVILDLIVEGTEAISAMRYGCAVIGCIELNGGSSANVSISGWDPGTSPEKQTEVFDAFFTTKQHGMGIGLSFARSIVQAQGSGRRTIPKGGAVFRESLATRQEEKLARIVYVVDDDASFRTAIERRLKKAGYIVATYPSAQQLLDNLPDEEQPGCILLDVRIPDLSGPELQDRLGQVGSSLPIVFLTGYTDVPTTVRTIKAGAEDFLTKPVSSEQLLRAIEQAIARHEASRDLKRKLDIQRELLATLTPRERQVFERVVQGKINKQIGQQLGATERTIKAHRHRVMEKMKVQSLAELVSIAERLGVLASAPVENRNS